MERVKVPPAGTVFVETIPLHQAIGFLRCKKLHIFKPKF